MEKINSNKKGDIGIVEKAGETSSDTGISITWCLCAFTVLTVDMSWNAETHPHHTV